MLKLVLIVTVVAIATAVVFAQTSTTKKSTTAHKAGAAHRAPAATGPTKVTGPGTTTPSGLQYWDIKVGTGPAAETGKTVDMEYTGWLTSGKKFDSNAGSGHPFTLHLGAGEVIKGWDEGIVGMKVGGKRQLKIPPQLAYGEQGYPGAIPANATLIFDVKLLGVK
jgi:FKBP-type peptidyl-prolyl cis-trans isomerase